MPLCGRKSADSIRWIVLSNKWPNWSNPLLAAKVEFGRLLPVALGPSYFVDLAERSFAINSLFSW
jgi:hypothetical protein